MIRKSKNKANFIRRIQRWLAKHEYRSGYGIELHRCDLVTEYHEGVALCRTGVVLAQGGGCVIEPWSYWRLDQLRRFFRSAQRCAGSKS